MILVYIDISIEIKDCFILSSTEEIYVRLEASAPLWIFIKEVYKNLLYSKKDLLSKQLVLSDSIEPYLN